MTKKQHIRIPLDILYKALCVLYVAAFLLFISSLSGVGRGIWPQSELQNCLFFAIAAGMAGVLLLFFVKNKLLIRRLGATPTILFPALIALWSLAVLPFERLPIRHLIGPPQSGEGAAAWFAITIYVAAGTLLLRKKNYRYFLTFFAMTVVLCLTVAHLAQQYPTFESLNIPYNFPDYLSWSHLGILVALFNLKPTVSFRTLIPAVLGFLFLQHAIDNQAGVLFAAFALPGILILNLIFQKLIPSDRTRMALLTIALGLIPTLITTFILILPQVITNGSWYATDPKFSALGSVLSRSYLFLTGLAPLVEHPLKAVTGMGWGTYNEQVIAYLPLDWVDTTQKLSHQWDGITWDHFHTHNIFIDTLMSTGIGGLIPLLCLWVGLLYWTDQRYHIQTLVLTTGMLTLGSFWFIFPLSWPFLALALAGLGHPTVKGDLTKRSVLIWAVPIILGVAIISLTIAVYITGATALRYDFRNFNRNLNPPGQCQTYSTDFHSGGLNLARLLMGQLRELTGAAHDKKLSKDLAKNFPYLDDLFCQAKLYARNEPYVGIRLKYTIVTTHGEALFMLDPYLSGPQKMFYADGWEDDLSAWLKTVPHRTDVAVPYLSYYVARNDDRHVAPIARQIFDINPNDPVGLWYTGLIMLTEPAQSPQGLDRMRRALNHGIERFIAVDPAAKAMLTQSPASSTN